MNLDVSGRQAYLVDIQDEPLDLLLPPNSFDTSLVCIENMTAEQVTLSQTERIHQDDHFENISVREVSQIPIDNEATLTLDEEPELSDAVTDREGDGWPPRRVFKAVKDQGCVTGREILQATPLEDKRVVKKAVVEIEQLRPSSNARQALSLTTMIGADQVLLHHV